jgi:glutamyl-tRNA synthetase
LWDQTDFFFNAPETYDEAVVKKRWKEDSGKLLTELRALLETTTDFSADNTELLIKTWIEGNSYNTGEIMNVFRLVIVGTSRGPHIFDIISWIGKEETLKRIDKGVTRLSK